ncbi:uncharacterized protein BcabD6B2_18840 [Babesia caballi]|uniref:Uncharacterized protein n=1 Tax=Babesia caballi TaxID=5871 RepID=A0AAV4LRL7_BABCB|nr:hypothetical protein BcabD6B2_18840 [Babesia caballi]
MVVDARDLEVGERVVGHGDHQGAVGRQAAGGRVVAGSGAGELGSEGGAGLGLVGRAGEFETGPEEAGEHRELLGAAGHDVGQKEVVVVVAAGFAEVDLAQLAPAVHQRDLVAVVAFGAAGRRAGQLDGPRREAVTGEEQVERLGFEGVAGLRGGRIGAGVVGEHDQGALAASDHLPHHGVDLAEVEGAHGLALVVADVLAVEDAGVALAPAQRLVEPGVEVGEASDFGEVVVVDVLEPVAEDGEAVADGEVDQGEVVAAAVADAVGGGSAVRGVGSRQRRGAGRDGTCRGEVGEVTWRDVREFRKVRVDAGEHGEYDVAQARRERDAVAGVRVEDVQRVSELAA